MKISIEKKNKKRLAAYNRARYQTRLALEREKGKKWRESHPIVVMLAKAKSRAKRAGVPFAIDARHIEIPAVCPVLGIPLSRSFVYRGDSSPSLDRVVPSVGYVPHNVRVISNRANSIKRDGTAEEHRRIAAYIERVAAVGEFL